MAENIRVPIDADTTPMKRRIADDASRLRVSVKADLDSKHVEAFSRPLGKITGQADEFTKSMEAANARVLAFGASVSVINAITNAFKGLISSTVEVEKSLNEIKIIGNETFSNLGSVSKGVFENAKQLGVSYRDAADATLEFARQGKDLQTSLDASRAALALTRTTGLEAAESVKGLTSAVNVFSDSGLSYIDIVNKMSSVDSNFAVNSKDLIEGISRSASVAQEAGVSFDELTAFITTLQEKTGRGGAVIGNALKTIFTRVQNPEILKDIRDLGIAVTDTSGNFLPATKIIQSLANQFDSLDSNVRKNILLKVGGGFQVDKLAAALNDMASANGTFQRSLQVSQSGTGDVISKVGEMNKTIDAGLTNFFTSAKEAGSLIGTIAFSEDFKSILQSGSNFFDSISATLGGKTEDGESASFGQQIAKGIIKGIGSVITGPGLFLFGGILIKLAADFAKFSTTAIQTQLGITTKSKEEEAIQKSISTVLSGNTDLQQQLLNLEGNKVAQAAVLLDYYTRIAASMERQKTLSKDMSKALREGGVRMAGGKFEVKGSGPIEATSGPAKTAAGGYIPNLATAIATEKAQSPSGSKILVDHNFPMGGGQKGTMVYNSNETRIKNFGGSGGDAIIPNYPVSAASGYTPNFAKDKEESKYAIGGKGQLDINARDVPLAGITMAGNKTVVNGKSLSIDDKLLKQYVGSPLFDTLREYDRISVKNVDVGPAYKFRKDLKADEDTIKNDFTTRLNASIRPQILDFIQSEIKSLGLKPGAGLSKGLEGLNFNIMTPSSAGYVLEEIIKAPTLTTPEKVAQYAAQSSKSYFDIHNLSAEDAEAFGLPKRPYAYADVKLGENELEKTITKKYLNQVIYEGGGTKLTNAAKGYVPNFADKQETFLISKKMSEFGNIESKQKADPVDQFSSSVKIIRQDKTIKDYGSEANSYIKKIYPEKNNGKINLNQLNKVEKLFRDRGASETSLKTFRSTLTNSSNYGSFNSTIKGILGELDAKELIGKNIKGSNSVFDFAGYVDARTRRVDDPTNILIKGVNFWLRNKSYVNKKEDKLSLPSMTAIVPADSKIGIGLNYQNAAKGYIPNFATSNVKADIMTVNPMIGKMSLDSFIEKYISNNPGTGLRGTGGFVDAAVNQGENLSPEAKNDFIMSMLGINWLATFNKDAEANKARESLIREKSKSTNRFRTEKIGDLSSLMGNGEGSSKYIQRAVSDPNNVIEGAFSGSVKELKYENLHSLADGIFSKAGVSDIFNKDIVANMYKVAMEMHKTKDDQAGRFSRGQYNYGPNTPAIGQEFAHLDTNKPKVENEYSIIKKATAQLRPILIQGLLENDKKAQGFLVNPPEQDISAVGNSSKYLALLDPKAANLKKYVSDYLLNPSKEPLAEGSPEAIKNKINLESIRSFLDENHQATYSRKPIQLDNLKYIRSLSATNPQLRKFFSEGTGSAFKNVSMGFRDGKKAGLTAWWNDNLTQTIVDNINDILSASINRGGIFPLENLDFKFNGVPAEKNNTPNPLSTFVNSPEFASKNYPPDLQKYIKDGSIAYGDWKNLKDNPAVQEDLLKHGLKGKYNPTSKRVDILSMNAANGYVPNFVSERGMNAMNEIAKGNTPEAEVARAKLSQLGAGLSFEAIKNKRGSSSYVAKMKDQIIASVDMNDLGSEIGLDSAIGNEDILQKLLQNFAIKNKGRKISYPSSSENASIVKSALKLKDGVDLQEGDLVGSATKGFIPNFALKDNLKTGGFGILKELAINSIEGFFNLPDKTIDQVLDLAQGQGKNIIDYLSSYFEDSSLVGGGTKESIRELMMQRGYWTPDGLKWIHRETGKIKYANAKTASKGYTPNFASEKEAAIIREKMATGLPESMIKVSTDSRAIHPILNPTGQIVTNKIDEPNGASDVTASRMRHAYANASSGYIPNFADPPKLAALESFKQVTGANIDTSSVTKSLDKVSSTNEKLNITQQQLAKTIQQQASRATQKGELFTQLDSSPIRTPGIRSKEKDLINEVEGKVAKALTELISQYLDNGKNMALLNKAITEQRRKLGLTQKTMETLITENVPSSISKNWVGPEISTQTSPAEPTTPTGGKNNQVNPQQINKSFADVAGKIIIFQGGLSLLTGFIGSFGDNMQKVAGIVNDFGVAFMSITQAKDLQRSILGDKDPTELAKKIRGTYDASRQNGGNLFASAKAAFGSAGGPLGGALNMAALALPMMGQAIAIAQIAKIGFNALEDGIKAFAHTAEKGQNAISDLNAALEKYNYQTNTQGKEVASKVLASSSITGAGLSGALNTNAMVANFRSNFSSNGSNNLINKTNITKLMGATGLNEQDNTKIITPLTELISSKISAENTKNGKVPLSSFVSKKTLEELDKITGQINQEADKKMVDVVKYTGSYGSGATNTVRTTTKESISGQERELFIQQRLREITEEKAKSSQKYSSVQKEIAESIGYSVELLKKRFEIDNQIFKLRNNLLSSGEIELSVSKELLSNDQNRRAELELQLKLLQEQKQTNNEIKESVLSGSTEKINKFLTDRGISASEKEKEELSSALKSVRSKLNNGESPDLVITEQLNQLKAANQAGLQNPEMFNQVKEGMTEAVRLITESSQIRKQDIASQNLISTIISKQNYAYNLQKEIINAKITNQQKDIELEQKKLEIANKVADAQFKISLINKQNANEDPYIAQRADQLRNIDLIAKREKESFSFEERKNDLSNRQSIVNLANQRGATVTQLKDITNAGSTESAMKKLEEVFSQEGSAFEKRVTTAGDLFFDSIKKSAELMLEFSTKQFETETRTVTGDDGTTSEITVLINKLNKTEYNSPAQYIESLVSKQQKTNQQPAAIIPSAADQRAILPLNVLANPTVSINAEKNLRLEEFNQSIRKRFFDFESQRLTALVTAEQKALEYLRQRISDQEKLKDLQFEAQNLKEYNPFKAEKASARFQIQKNVTQAQSSDLVANQSYLVESKNRALTEAKSKGASAEQLQSIASSSNVDDIVSKLQKVIEDDINKTTGLKPGEEILNGAVKAKNEIINAAKIFTSTINANPNSPTFTQDNLKSSALDDSLPKDYKSLLFKKGLIEDQAKKSNIPLDQLKSGNLVYDTNAAAYTEEELNKLAENYNNVTEAVKRLQIEQDTALKGAGIIARMAVTNGGSPAQQSPGAIEQSKQAFQNQQLKEDNQTKFGLGFKQGVGEIDASIEKFDAVLGKQIPNDFASAMKSAMIELSDPNSTKPLQDRLLGVAAAFLQKINEALMGQAANKITSSLFSSSGAEKGSFASGGPIKGGSGSKDDVPAMLMGGEFVLKKSAVQKYGISYIDSLNKGKVQKYANGGIVSKDGDFSNLKEITAKEAALNSSNYLPYASARNENLIFDDNGKVINDLSYTGIKENKQDAMTLAQTQFYSKNQQGGERGFYTPGENGAGSIMGAENLLRFATQQTTSSEFDKIQSSKNSASIDLAGGSSNMSLFALRDQGNSRNASYLQAKQKASDLYFSDVEASKEKEVKLEEIRIEQERLKQAAKTAERQAYQGLIRQAGMSIGMVGLGTLGSSMAKGYSAANQASNGNATFLQKLGGAFTGGSMKNSSGETETRGGLFNAFNSTGNKDFSTIASPNGGLQVWNSKSNSYVKMNENKYNEAFPYGASYDKMGTPTALKNNPFKYSWQQSKAAGGSVVGNGMGDNVPTMLNGGEFIISKQAAQNIGPNKLQQLNSTGKTGEDSSKAITDKLDELVEKLSTVGTLNITINSDSNGKQTEKQDGGNQDQKTREMARKIKEVVLGILKDEKRLGGMLR